METIVAAAQYAPVHLNLEASLEKLRAIAAEAAGNGVRLLVFPESFLPGYPDWVWRTPAWSEIGLRSYRRLAANAVRVPGPAGDALAETARTHRIHLAVGVTESLGSTLYNSLLLFDDEGELIHHHRKLMPTGGERVVWGFGDGSTLGVVDTALGRIGGLICWESYMPLARAALYGQDVQLYLAPTWDTSDVWVPTLRHIAKEGRTFVIGCCQALHSSDLPDDTPGKSELYGDEWLARGLSTIVTPGGHVIAGPLEEKEGLVIASLDLNKTVEARGLFDPTGHYARPDVLRLHVDRTAKRAVD